MMEHRCFTVSSTNYLRNLDREDLSARCIAIHYQKPPVQTSRGTSIGLRFPMLIVANYLEQPDDVAQRVADILEQHWTDDQDRVQPGETDPYPEPPLPDSQLANGGACS